MESKIDNHNNDNKNMDTCCALLTRLLPVFSVAAEQLQLLDLVPKAETPVLVQRVVLKNLYTKRRNPFTGSPGFRVHQAPRDIQPAQNIRATGKNLYTLRRNCQTGCPGLRAHLGNQTPVTSISSHVYRVC